MSVRTIMVVKVVMEGLVEVLKWVTLKVNQDTQNTAVSGTMRRVFDCSGEVCRWRPLL